MLLSYITCYQLKNKNNTNNNNDKFNKSTTSREIRENKIKEKKKRKDHFNSLIPKRNGERVLLHGTIKKETHTYTLVVVV